MQYCVGVVEESVEAKRQALQDSAGDDAASQRRARGTLYAEEVKVRARLVAL